MYIRTRDTYPSGTELELRIRADDQTLETSCVVRDVLPGGLGVEFTWLRGPLEAKLQKILFVLKRKAQGRESKVENGKTLEEKALVAESSACFFIPAPAATPPQGSARRT